MVRFRIELMQLKPLRGGLQLNFGGIGVELRMKERRIEGGYTRKPVSPLFGSCLICTLSQAELTELRLLRDISNIFSVIQV